jgi:hypothetical protein
VTTAPQLDLVDGCLASQGVRVEVVEFHEPTLAAAMAAGADEGAAPEIPQPDGALDLS